jgi:glycosyltransferase involved in cell wall biosynthesis
MNRIHFSIVTVVKDDLLGLKKSRASLESQAFKNWTHIIVDGGSSRATINYLKSLSDINTIYISEPDSGIYNAMNKGWKLALPESYVFYLNARDVFVGKKSLYEAAKSLKAANFPVWGCSTHEEIQQDGSGWVCKLVSPPSVPNQLYAFGYRSHQAVLMKSNFIDQLGGFNEKYKIASDWELIVKALEVAKPAVWNHPLGLFELGGKSQDNLLLAHLELKLIRKEFLPQTIKQKIYEPIWCAIYLRMFGYQNFYTPLLSILTLQRKRKKVNKVRRIKQSRRWVTQIPIGNFGIQISFYRRTKLTIKEKDSKSFRIKLVRYYSSLHSKLVLYIHGKLNIAPYEKP